MFWWKNYAWYNGHMLFLISGQKQKYQFGKNTKSRTHSSNRNRRRKIKILGTVTSYNDCKSYLPGYQRMNTT
jgi:hypothetical protein